MFLNVRIYIYLSLHGLPRVNTCGRVATNRRTAYQDTLQGYRWYSLYGTLAVGIYARVRNTAPSLSYGSLPARDGNSSLHYVPEGFPSRARAWLHYSHNGSPPSSRKALREAFCLRQDASRRPPQESSAGYSLFFFLALAREKRKRGLREERVQFILFFLL